MQTASPNLRKAAVLIRSLDGETAATLLAQLSPEEAAEIRAAIRSLGPFDDDEQADVVAALRRGKPMPLGTAEGVELALSASQVGAFRAPPPKPARRFEFLDDAPIEAIARFLAGEHPQTSALVLSHLAPERAVDVLSILPARPQAEILERLSRLGTIDPDSVLAVEQELAAWIARQPRLPDAAPPTRSAIESILAAADPSTRDRILTNLSRHNERLAARVAPNFGHSQQTAPTPIRERARPKAMPLIPLEASAVHPPRSPARPPNMLRFSDVNRFTDEELATLVKHIDDHLLGIALVGASEYLVERFAKQMPRGRGKALRNQLSQLGPTRLSDVESAQQAVADVAARWLRPALPQMPR